MVGRSRRGVALGVVCAAVLCACARTAAVAPSGGTMPVVGPTALVMAGLRHDERGEHEAALADYRRALAAARAVYGDGHPNTGFAEAALGVWHARFGRVAEARPHLVASRRIDDAAPAPFANVAETRLPASVSDPVAQALVRLRLQRDLLLCTIDGGCGPVRILGLAEALGRTAP